jgi:hypothetical protein
METDYQPELFRRRRGRIQDVINRIGMCMDVAASGDSNYEIISDVDND